MLLHVFRSSASGLHGVTHDPSGGALPREVGGGAWRYVRDIELEDGEQRIAIDSSAALSEIRERGYHLLAGLYPRL